MPHAPEPQPPFQFARPPRRILIDEEIARIDAMTDEEFAMYLAQGALSGRTKSSARTVRTASM